MTFFDDSKFFCIRYSKFSEIFSKQQIIKPAKLHFAMIFVLFSSRFFTPVSLKYFIISVVDFGKKSRIIIKALALHTVFIDTSFVKVCIVLRTNRKSIFR